MCSHDGCDGQPHSKGRCVAHYSAWYREQNADKIAAYNASRRANAVPLTKACAECGGQFTTTISTKRFCSRLCQRREERRRHRAEKRHYKDYTCSECGKRYRANMNGKRKGDATYCSIECQGKAKAWRYRKVFSCKVPWKECKRCTRTFLGRGAASHCHRCVDESEPSSRRWVAGYCIRCGDPFVGRWHPMWPCRYCSDRCNKKDGKDRRRARKREAFIEEVWRTKVYERDNWTCRICNKPVDREAQVPEHFAPTLDHILPLALGGDHSYANIQTAHFICNSRKGASAEGQLAFAA